MAPRVSGSTILSCVKSLRWFAAGAVAVPLFHQVALWILNVTGAVARSPFAMTPTRPFGVPQLISLAFWGGLWGVILGLFISERTPRVRYWIFALVFGAVAPTLVAAFVVPPIKGQPITADLRFFLNGTLLNGAWGVGTAALFALLSPRKVRSAV